MTVAQAAKKIGVSASKLYQLSSARQISHYRVGGKIIFSDEDIAAFLARCHVAVTPQLSSPPASVIKLKHLRLT